MLQTTVDDVWSVNEQEVRKCNEHHSCQEFHLRGLKWIFLVLYPKPCWSQLILVVCEYATCSFSLTRIDAPRIANKLIDLYARVGIPQEILTDRGSNFTSELLNEIYHLLHVHPIRTTPYHSQTNGACGTIILTRPLSHYYVKWRLRQARIGIDYFRTYCLPTMKSLKHPLDSFLLRKRCQEPLEV